MRYLFFCLFFFSVTSSYAQETELLGKYGAFFIGGETIEFVGKDSFYFGGYYCTYGMEGKGRCEIRDDHLYLYFSKSKNKIKQDSLKLPVISKTSNPGDVSIIQLTCADNNDIPVPYMTIYVEYNNKTTIATMTDSLGQTTLQVKNNGQPIIIKTSAVPFEPGQVKLDGNSNYTVKLFHQTTTKELKNGEVFIYEIEDVSNDLLTMRPQNSNGPFRQYRKLKQ